MHYDEWKGIEGVKTMFKCGECFTGILWMSGSSLIEHIPEGEHVPENCYIDSKRPFIAKFQFTCEQCQTEFNFVATAKFTQFPEKS